MTRPISRGAKDAYTQTQQNEGDWTMSNAKKIVLSAAIIMGTAFSALTTANAGFTTVSQGGTGVAAYSSDGGIVSGNWR